MFTIFFEKIEFKIFFANSKVFIQNYIYIIVYIDNLFIIGLLFNEIFFIK